MKRGFYTIMAAQFLSSLADNALLIAAIALLASLGAPEWQTPLLKLFFVVSYVLLAAWVGIFADSMPKGRVMFLTNFLKAVGCLLMLFGGHPLLAYAIVGIGAAAYSPAKYGILTELLPAEKLVIANGWIEGLTVGSIILGVVLGGVLIKPEIASPILSLFHLNAIGLTSFAEAAIFAITFVYVAASIVNLAIPDTGARYPKQKFDPIDSIRGFMTSCRLLWHDRLGQISLSVTTLFWGAGAVLAAARVPLVKSLSVLPMGIIMGALVMCMAFFTRADAPAGGIELFGQSLSWAVIIASIGMIAVGICAGFFVVPMNALLQHRGHVLMSAGRSIAVQNFNENLSILTMLGVYSLLIKFDLSVPATMLTFGGFVMVSMALVILKHHRNQREFDSTHLIGEDKRH
ncbi:lysophospholipid transporter LplT [Sutterella wadsworthensis]|uniref:lysophospholipid transporter LplT n=1 Tax=Sutterella wadsworthensis TaxID=40545 RepID=UPI001C02A495|nr:lysophospholipid transporter LplT [Sutterella wadsworthensis]MBT9621785.1 lysophospholipid transporter LplT [Sutterella wadsworthensis]